jgi:hypothetical protein
MDEHVPKAITIGLRLGGIDVLTVQEDNFSGKSDSELLAKFGEIEEIKNQIVFLPLKK